MKKMFLASLGLCLSVIASAQKNFFLYLQTDDQTPFYVRMSDKVFSSSTAGYLILPNLADTTYIIGVGFPKSTQPETRFSVAINQTDKGYLLKNFTDGLSLFDIEDLSVVKPVSANKDNVAYETKTDKFSSVLSKAADDPSLLKVPIAKKEEPKAEPEKKEATTVQKEESKPEQKEPAIATTENKKLVGEKPKDTVAQKPIETVNAAVEKKEEPIKTETPISTDIKLKTEEKQPTLKDVASNAAQDYKPSVVVRRSESSTTEGFGIIYFDKMEERTDTVRILIPPSKFKLDQDTPPVNTNEVEKKQEAATTTSKPDAKATQTDTLINSTKEKIESRPTVDKTTKVSTTTICKELASDKDFMKLRKNMAAKSSDDDMIFEAKKAFKIRCYTAEQVRYLSTLFLTPAAKYQFFDSAYNYVSDKENFAALQSEIKDDYYLKRFKALVGE